MDWDTAQELGSARGLAFLFWVYRRLGRLPFQLAVLPVLAWFFAFKPAPRGASREYLSRALGRPARSLDVLRHFFSFADGMLDKLIAWSGGYSLSDLSFHGHEAILSLLDQGRGCLMIGSHLGNIEVGRMLSGTRPGFEMHVLAHTLHAERFNRVLRELDPSSQVNLHQVTHLDMGLAAFLSERVGRGAVVVMAGDRAPVGRGERSAQVPFLGRDAAFPQGPYLLAAALGCPVLLLFCLRRPGGFDIHYEPFADAIRLPREGREEAVRALAARYAARLEHYCRRAPYQWYNFYRFW